MRGAAHAGSDRCANATRIVPHPHPLSHRSCGSGEEERFVAGVGIKEIERSEVEADSKASLRHPPPYFVAFTFNTVTELGGKVKRNCGPLIATD